MLQTTSPEPIHEITKTSKGWTAKTYIDLNPTHRLCITTSKGLDGTVATMAQGLESIIISPTSTIETFTPYQDFNKCVVRNHNLSRVTEASITVAHANAIDNGALNRLHEEAFNFYNAQGEEFDMLDFK